MNAKRTEKGKPVEQDIASRIYLAKEGVSVVAAICNQATQGERPEGRHILLSMLALKVADHLRLSAHAISSGYFYSAPILLRGALDSIGVLCSTARDPKEFKKWVFLTYMKGNEPGFDPIQLREIRTEFYTRARSAYDNLLSSDANAQPVRELIWSFNIHVHPGLEGLMEIVSAPIKLDELLGVEMKKVLELADGDINRAIDFIGLSSDKPKKQPKTKETPANEAEESPQGRFNEEILDSYSSILHAATHHLVELTAFTFKEAIAKELLQAANDWQAHSSFVLKGYKKGKSRR